jgi:hypothetical protein
MSCQSGRYTKIEEFLMQDEDIGMSEEERTALDRYEARRAVIANNERFMEFAGRCSCDYLAFWKPYEGLQLAFGSTGKNGRVNNLTYVIELIRPGKEWHITLIASRDLGLPAGEGNISVALRTFQSDDPQCPEGYSALQKKLWVRIHEHFSKFKPSKLRA